MDHTLHMATTCLHTMLLVIQAMVVIQAIVVIQATVVLQAMVVVQATVVLQAMAVVVKVQRERPQQQQQQHTTGSSNRCMVEPEDMTQDKWQNSNNATGMRWR